MAILPAVRLLTQRIPINIPKQSPTCPQLLYSWLRPDADAAASPRSKATLNGREKKIVETYESRPTTTLNCAKNVNAYSDPPPITHFSWMHIINPLLHCSTTGMKINENSVPS